MSRINLYLSSCTHHYYLPVHYEINTNHRNHLHEGSTLDTSFKLLHEAQLKLKSIVHNKFDAAVMTRDAASVERFFKTFPLIGENQSGLAKFSKYLCSQVLKFKKKEQKYEWNC